MCVPLPLVEGYEIFESITDPKVELYLCFKKLIDLKCLNSFILTHNGINPDRHSCVENVGV